MEVAVIGSGTMGNGIAHTFALSGYKVVLIDVNNEALTKALETVKTNLQRQLAKSVISQNQLERTLNNIQPSTTLKESVRHVDLVVEAATEKENIKLDIFRQLELYCKPSTILASNTSSISISHIAAATNRPDKVIGMHFMNPVPVMKLVEVIKGRETSEATFKFIMDTSFKLDKVPVEVNDAPGFVANRILMPMINEAIYTLYEGVAGVREIDTVMRLGMFHPMGPLQLADHIGLDVCLAILKVMQTGFDSSKYAPCPLLVDMVEKGQLGNKSGLGFYLYQKGSKELAVASRFL